MKLIQIIVMVLLLGSTHAQQVSTFEELSLESSIANSYAKDQAREIKQVYRVSEKSQKPSWYVTTDAQSQQTSILFLNSNKRVIYHEVLPQQFVELTKHNRRILDQMLSKLINGQFVSDKLKTSPIRYENPARGLSNPEYIQNPNSEIKSVNQPYGIQQKAMLVNDQMLYIWCKTPEQEKLNFQLRDGSERMILFNTVRKTLLTDVVRLNSLTSGIYEIKLYGKTWEYFYQLEIDREKNVLRLVPRM